ncbi:MAG: hypothetical protein ABEJ78_11180 [Haloferacaceae archaeon]
MGNVSHASDAEIIAAWELLHGRDVDDDVDLVRLDDDTVGKPGSCKLWETETEEGRMQWTVSRELLTVVVAQRGLEHRVEMPVE